MIPRTPVALDRRRIPLRLLIGDRGEEAPFDAALLLSVVEQRPVMREHRAHALLQQLGVDALDLRGVRHVTVGELRERAIAAKARDEAIEIPAQVREARRHGPRDVACRPGRKGDVEIEIDVAHERGSERIDDRVADSAVRDLRDEGRHRRQREGIPMDPGMRGARGGDFRLESGVGNEGDAGAVEVAPFRGFVAVPVVDQHGLGAGHARRPQHGIALRFGACRVHVRRHGGLARRGRRRRPVKPAGADMRLAVGNARNHLRRRVGNGELERELLLGGKLAGEVHVESGKRAVRPDKIERGSRPEQHDELLGFLGRGEGSDATMMGWQQRDADREGNARQEQQVAARETQFRSRDVGGSGTTNEEACDYSDSREWLLRVDSKAAHIAACRRSAVGR
jgi:hypothetical protein